MGLKKEIELDNGVILNYHRVVSLNKITNILNTIEVNSYISASQREKEKAYQELQLKSANIAAAQVAQKTDIDEDGNLVSSGNQIESLTEAEQEALNQGINVLVITDFINIPYDEKMTIQTAYEYLRTTEKYKDAENY